MANTKKCDCHETANPNELNTMGFMAHAASKVIAGRVTKGTARALADYCSTHNCSQSTALRKALELLSSSSDDPAAALKALRELLGLDPAAAQEDVTAAVTALFTQAGDEGDGSADGLEEGPDPAPQKLSAADEARAAKMTPAQKSRFIRLRAERVRRV